MAMKYTIIYKIIKVFENKFIRLNCLNDIKSYDFDDGIYIDKIFDIKDDLNLDMHKVPIQHNQSIFL
jgi:hypothetical protein